VKPDYDSSGIPRLTRGCVTTWVTIAINPEMQHETNCSDPDSVVRSRVKAALTVTAVPTFENCGYYVLYADSTEKTAACVQAPLVEYMEASLPPVFALQYGLAVRRWSIAAASSDSTANTQYDIGVSVYSGQTS